MMFCGEISVFKPIYIEFINRNEPAPVKYPIAASHPIFFRYQKNDIFSIPMATTPAADPMINILPPVPAA